MFIKIVLSLLSPLGSAIFGFIVAMLLWKLGKKRLAKVLHIFSLCWLYAWSTPWLAGQLSYLVEWKYPPVPIEMVPHADAAVVLGGGLGPSGLAERGLEGNLSPSADRITYAAKLYHAGKAPKLLLAGGSPLLIDNNIAEAELMRQLLIELGVPASALVLEADSKTTIENAQNSLAIIEQHGWQNLLLVTSAKHMGRAMALYVSDQYSIQPAATDYDALMLLARPCCLPTNSALAMSSQLFKELVGQLVNKRFSLFS